MPPKKKSVDATEAPEVVEESTPTTVEVAAPANAAPAHDESAPAIVVAGTPTEMYAQLQAVVAQNPARINDHVGPVLELMQAAEDPASPILLRVRFLEFIARNVANLRDNNALKKIVMSLVKVIGSEDNTPQLLTAALQCFPGLGPVSMVDKRWEYLSREGADILMQVIIDRDAFAEQVRHAARTALDALTTTAFRSVVTKLMHWLSDEREEDEAEQIQRERHLALNTLGRLALSPSQKAHWTEDTQEYVLSLIYRILGIVDAREFAQLARIAAHMPLVHAKHGLPVLETFLAENKLDSERNVEAVSILSRFIVTTPRQAESTPAPIEFDLVTPMEAAGLLAPGAMDGESRRGMLIARVALLAARLAPAEAAARLLPALTTAVRALTQAADGSTALPPNLSTLEAALFAAVAVATKKPVEMLQVLNGEDFCAAMTAVSASAAALEPELVYAIKKKMRDNKAGADDAEALACVHNIQVITGSFAAKHVPMGDIKESWTGKAKLPTLKRSRDPAAAAGLPPAPGTAAANDRARLASHADPTGRGGNRHRGAGSGDRKDHRRDQSSGGRQPRKVQRTSSNNGGAKRRH